MALPHMPAHNKPSYSVKLGAGQKSKFGSGVSAGAAQRAATAKRAVGKPHMAAHNNGRVSMNMGTTKHGVGQVPGYLKGNC